MPPRPLHRLVCGLALCGALTLALTAPADTQPASTPTPKPAAQNVVVPSFWDPRRRPERPDTSRMTLIRFMTEVDYPPFNYAGSDGNPAGFNVDLARLICDELKIPCTMQMRRFDTLIDSLNDNRGDAAIASIAVTPDTRARVDFSDPYYRPASRASRRWSMCRRSNSRARRSRWSQAPHMTNTPAHCLPKPTSARTRPS